MKHIKYIISILVVIFTNPCFSQLSDNELVKQGSVILTINDFLGYTFLMPKDVRKGFLESSDRVGKSLDTLLLMKHVTNYAYKNKLLDNSKVDKIVNNYLINKKDKIKEKSLSDLDYSKFIAYLTLDVSFETFQESFKKEISKINVEDLAMETYLVEKGKYFHKETRDISYFEIYFTEDNKTITSELVDKLIVDLKVNNSDANFVKEKYLDYKEIKLVSGINDFYYNDKYTDFSNFIFKEDTKGLVKGKLDAMDRYIVAIINEIHKERYDSYEDVKSKIISKIINDKTEREFGNLVSKLTLDKIEVNAEAIQSLVVTEKDNS